MARRRRPLREVIISKWAERKVVELTTPPPVAPPILDLSKSRVAFVTTSGVRLKDDPPFNLKDGDPTFRVIPLETTQKDWVIDHSHYDIKAATEDANIVFPLDILKEFQKEGIIGSLGPRHYGLMGYIPQFKKLMNIYAPQIADQLQEDEVDLVLLSPG